MHYDSRTGTFVAGYESTHEHETTARFEDGTSQIYLFLAEHHCVAGFAPAIKELNNRISN